VTDVHSKILYPTVTKHLFGYGRGRDRGQGLGTFLEEDLTYFSPTLFHLRFTEMDSRGRPSQSKQTGRSVHSSLHDHFKEGGGFCFFFFPGDSTIEKLEKERWRWNVGQASGMMVEEIAHQSSKPDRYDWRIFTTSSQGIFPSTKRQILSSSNLQEAKRARNDGPAGWRSMSVSEALLFGREN